MLIDCGPCALRRWRYGDEHDLIRHADNWNIACNLRDRFPHPYTMDDALGWLKIGVEESPRTTFAITVDDRIVGSIGFILGSDINRCSAEFGYWVGEEFWGRGIATAAVRAAVRYAFQEFPLEHITALVFAHNTASARVLEKCGFLREGLLRRHAVKEGKLIDEIIYGILREEVSLETR